MTEPTDRMDQNRPARLAAHVEAARLDPGLYLVATPIGTARDITLRALDVLNSADLLAAEDTRTLRHLMDIHGVPLRGRRVLSYHDHNGERARPALMAALAEGASIAYASDAGTPLVADPGYRLALEAAEAGHRVHALPGPSAALAALSLSGLPSDRFLFLGFPPPTETARRAWLGQWIWTDATLILFESPRRINRLLSDLCEIDPNRITVVARELTKKFEEIIRGRAADLAAHPRMGLLKGEIVVLLDRAARPAPGAEQLDERLRELMARLSVKDAAKQASEEFGLPRRDLYQRALDLGRDQNGRADRPDTGETDGR